MDTRRDREDPQGSDDECLPPEPTPGTATRLLVRGAAYGEGVVYPALALLLFGIAVLVLVQTAQDLLTPLPDEAFAETITRALNGVLFVVIVIEVLRTIVSRLQGQGFRLQPYLVIAIKCCLFEERNEVDGRTVVTPWGASFGQLRQALSTAVRLADATVPTGPAS